MVAISVEQRDPGFSELKAEPASVWKKDAGLYGKTLLEHIDWKLAHMIMQLLMRHIYTSIYKRHTWKRKIINVAKPSTYQ